MPAILGASRQLGTSPSRVLMPLSFASQLGGTLTLIGTSTNLLVAGLVLDLGFDRIRIFDLTPPALLVAAAGVAYLLTVGRWLTPDREAARDFLSAYDLHDYLTTVRVRADSPLVNRSIGESRLGQEAGLVVIRIERDSGSIVASPDASTVVRAEDVLLIEGTVEHIADMRDSAGIEIQGAEPSLPDLATRQGDDDDADAVRIVELLVPPRSR
jgi:di/tricarboxylate transporter